MGPFHDDSDEAFATEKGLAGSAAASFAKPHPHGEWRRSGLTAELSPTRTVVRSVAVASVAVLAAGLAGLMLGAAFGIAAAAVVTGGAAGWAGHVAGARWRRQPPRPAREQSLGD